MKLTGDFNESLEKVKETIFIFPAKLCSFKRKRHKNNNKIIIIKKNKKGNKSNKIK